MQPRDDDEPHAFIIWYSETFQLDFTFHGGLDGGTLLFWGSCANWRRILGLGKCRVNIADRLLSYAKKRSWVSALSFSGNVFQEYTCKRKNATRVERPLLHGLPRKSNNHKTLLTFAKPRRRTLIRETLAISLPAYLGHSLTLVDIQKNKIRLL